MLTKEGCARLGRLAFPGMGGSCIPTNMVSLSDRVPNCAITSSHSVRLNFPKDWMWISAPLFRVNMPTFCFRTFVCGSSESVYWRSKSIDVWLEFALSQSCKPASVQSVTDVLNVTIHPIEQVLSSSTSHGISLCVSILGSPYLDQEGS